MDEMNLEKALPAGAVPKDVADDVTAKVSEGEFIIPAHVVRYLGVSRLEKMVKKAALELEELNAGKPASQGSVVEEEDDLGEEALEEGQEEDDLPAFAEGGLVTQQPAPESSLTWEWQTTPSGLRIRVPIIRGKYVSSNFANKENMGGEGRNSFEAQKVGLDKDLKDWSVKDFSTYSRSVGTPQGRMGNSVANTLVGAVIVPAKGLIDKVTKKKDDQARQALEKMAATGLDQNGNPLSEEDKAAISEAKSLVDNPVKDGVGEKVARTVAGSVGSRDITKTAVKAADAATGGHLQNAVDKVKGVVDEFKDTVKDAIRGGVDTTYGQRKDAKDKEKKGLVDKPETGSSNKNPSSMYSDADRHSDGTPNVTGNSDYDREIEDSINR